MNGIQSILQSQWELKLVTPLRIGGGYTSAFKGDGGGAKTRNLQMEFGWNQEAGENRAEVNDLHIGVLVEPNEDEATPEKWKADVRYTIPAASIRGALRSWTVSRLVSEEYRHLLTVPEKKDAPNSNIETNIEAGTETNTETDTETGGGPAGETDRRVSAVKYAMETNRAFEMAVRLFGMALDTADDGKGEYSQAGTLSLEVAPLEDQGQPTDRPWVQGEEWRAGDQPFGPDNAARHLRERGPVDRLTHGAKDGGLHTMVELSPGQSFTVTMRLKNPDPADLGLLSAWEREMEYGLLRVGALKSVGRGRLEIIRKTHTFFHIASESIGRKMREDWKIPADAKPVSLAENEKKEVFLDLWKAWDVTPADTDERIRRIEILEEHIMKRETEEAAS